ncbi:prefoldin domain-containing protein [Wolbachia endosymbiont of Folsomia candida]|uniref:hypothetical protein n=1 Tax=Wolbachia endosymbiont of Folsomia candida TaxID=169402 RepID=UPI000DBF2E6A|nr:hypothetical protein [Wolbachia endosymbiont of Folsomia candida]APR98935.2 hypothetical protein ASM33_07030 [Wolbachia endosymbiont of Folsomia candida]
MLSHNSKTEESISSDSKLQGENGTSRSIIFTKPAITVPVPKREIENAKNNIEMIEDEADKTLLLNEGKISLDNATKLGLKEIFKAGALLTHMEAFNAKIASQINEELIPQLEKIHGEIKSTLGTNYSGLNELISKLTQDVDTKNTEFNELINKLSQDVDTKSTDFDDRIAELEENYIPPAGEITF